MRRASLILVVTVTLALNGHTAPSVGDDGKPPAAGGIGRTPPEPLAVPKSLKWLAKQQAADGSWSFTGGDFANPGTIKSKTGATALALQPFLGAGQTHKDGTYKSTVKKGLDYLLRKMKQTPQGADLRGDGDEMIWHGMAAWALCEAFAMTRDKALEQAAQDAVDFIHATQDPATGGWSPTVGAKPCTTVTAWQLMALQSAHMAYLEVSPDVVRRLPGFFNSVQADDGARYGETAPDDVSDTASAAALLCRMYLGWKRDDPALQRGVAQWSGRGPSKMNVSRDYFCHLVLRLCESTAWREWNGVMREHLVNAQVVDGDESGSWFNPNGVHAEDGGRLYQTAFNIMLLEVYYRHLPIYRAQSDEDDFPVDAADDKPLPSHRQFGTESYDRIDENAFRRPWQDPLSTFSIDVDTASYANARRFLERGDLPPADSVRIEEFINYFSYDYAPPTDEAPFATHVEIAACPWNKQHRLARIGIKGREISRDRRPPANLVFLLDVSGSMTAANKLPYVKTAMKMLVQNLTADDRVAIVVYAGASGLVLSSTPCSNKRAILEAIERLKAGGMTNGGEGIQLAYRVATENFAPDGVNRVVLCTDGDFNVGVTSQGALTQLIEEKADSGVFLTVFGFGMDNYKDSLLEKLADRGNGNYGYIDTIQEAHKMLVEQLSGTLVTIAKDVKIQVEFNPARVSAYRLIGYENRTMAAKDFADDKKDAGEIGAGHTVTALYELVAAEKEDQRSRPVPLRFQRPARLTKAARGDEAFELKLRYKDPDSDTSRLLLFPVADSDRPWSDASPDLQFAAAVAGFGMLLHDSLHKGNTTFKMVVELANAGKGDDPHGYRSELVRLVNLAQALAGNPP